VGYPTCPIFMEQKNIIIILRGAPGSGKSTWIKNNLIDPEICSADNYFINSNGVYVFNHENIGKAHGYCRYMFTRAVEDNKSLIVVDNTNIKKRDYKFYVDLGLQKGYKVYQKNLSGGPTYKNVHDVPEDIVNRMRGDFQEDKDLPEYPSIQDS
jgi:predicted kinase